MAGQQRGRRGAGADCRRNAKDLEAAFLIAIGRAALAGHKAAPQTEAEATARPVTLPPMPEAPAFDVDEFRRRMREHELAARLEELGRRNATAWAEQSGFTLGNQKRKDEDWDGR